MTHPVPIPLTPDSIQGDPAVTPSTVAHPDASALLALRASHTPGPWVVDEDPRPGMEWNRQIMAPGRNTAICFMAHSAGALPERDEANARLIAAAPELLAALQKSVDEIQYLRKHFKGPVGHLLVLRDRQEVSCAAIRKATEA